jgi:hypothetical protein
MPIGLLARITDRLKQLLASSIDRVESVCSGPSLTQSPDDWTDHAAWESFWVKVLEDKIERSNRAVWIGRSAVLDRLPLLRARPFRRILYAGNGICLEPHAIAHCGFEVIAVDVSASANRFVRETPVTPELLARFLPGFVPDRSGLGGRSGPTVRTYDLEASLRRVVREHRPGGSLTVLTADIFGYRPEQPFQLVVSQNSIQGFPEQDQIRLAERFFDWLDPGGFCLVETAMGRNNEFCNRLNRIFQSVGFVIHSPTWNLPLYWETIAKEDNQSAEWWATFGSPARKEEEELLRLLDRGLKLVYFSHSMS